MTYLWAKIIRRHRIVANETLPMEEGLLPALSALCARMDIPRPMFLPKHEREWAQFHQTAFTPDHFVEQVSFDKLEIEAYDPTETRKKSQDPRNG